MSSRDNHPKWWQLYLAFPLLVALFAIDTRLKLSTRGHQAVQIGTVLLVYGLVHLWLKANATVLSNMDRRQYYGGVKVFRIPPSRLPAADRERIQILQLPDTEIKGVLSDTFETDIIDAEFFPVDEVPQELKKE
jgi:hypothetical protein